MKQQKLSDNNNNKLVLLCTYASNEEALTIVTLLNNEGIPTFVDSYYTNMILGSVISGGGARLMIPQHDIDEAIKVMIKHGYSIPKYEPTTAEKLFEIAQNNAELKHFPHNWRFPLLLLFIVLIAGVIAAILIYINTKAISS